MLTIEEAATVLRISRGAAYALARRWRETSGREGIPCLQLGRSLRVPRDALHEMLAHPESAGPPGPGPELGDRGIRIRVEDCADPSLATGLASALADGGDPRHGRVARRSPPDPLIVGACHAGSDQANQ
ncbi:helix-turn-helix domain-containing protein [Iamia sp. SCSIO 61187]|nr:helix-turn-helix domain-containing protein [Iamia sp. SCSIO 61187]